MKVKSNKTTIAAGVAGLTMIAAAAAQPNIDRFQMIAQFVIGLALVVLGAVARDDNVTSEGLKVTPTPKLDEGQPADKLVP